MEEVYTDERCIKELIQLVRLNSSGRKKIALLAWIEKHTPNNDLKRYYGD